MAYDEDGNLIDTNSREDESLANELKKYIYDNDLKYINNDKHLEDEQWSIEVYTSNATYIIGGKDSEPVWFDELLSKLEVKEYGYISMKKDSEDNKINFGEEIELEKQNVSYNVENIISLDFTGIVDKTNYFRYTVKITMNGKEIDSKIFNNANDKVIWSKDFASWFKVTKVNNLFFIESFIASQYNGHYVLVINSNGNILDSYYNVDFTLDEDNNSYTITKCDPLGGIEQICPTKKYSILENNIK